MSWGFEKMDRMEAGRRTSWSLLAVLAAALLAVPAFAQDAAAETAPAATPTLSDSEALQARAKEYWKARATRSPEVVRFYAPVELGGPKRAKDVSEFGNIGYKDWSIQRVDVDGDKGVVQIAIQADFRLPAPKSVTRNLLSRTLHEDWIKVEGTWYKKPIPRGFSQAFEESSRARQEAAKAKAAAAEKTEKQTESE